jgi:hypothetical protein
VAAAAAPALGFDFFGGEASSLMAGPAGALGSGGGGAALSLDRDAGAAFLRGDASPPRGGGGGGGDGAPPGEDAVSSFFLEALPAADRHAQASLPAWPGSGQLPAGDSPAHAGGGGAAALTLGGGEEAADGAGASAPLKRLRSANAAKQPPPQQQPQQPPPLPQQQRAPPKKRAAAGGGGGGALTAAAAAMCARGGEGGGGSDEGSGGGASPPAPSPPPAAAAAALPPRTVLLSPRSPNLATLVERFFAKESAAPPSPQLLEARLAETPSLGALCAAARARWHGLMAVMAEHTGGTAARAGGCGALACAGVRACLLLRAPGTGVGECEATVLYAVATGGSGGDGLAAAEDFDFVALPAAAAAALSRAGALDTRGWLTVSLSPMVLTELAWPVGICAPVAGANPYLPACTLHAPVVRALPLDALCGAVGSAGSAPLWSGGAEEHGGGSGVSKWLYDISFMGGAPALSAPALLRRLDGSRSATHASLELDLMAWCLLLSEDVPGRAVALPRERAAAMVAAGVPGQLATEALAQLDARARSWAK